MTALHERIRASIERRIVSGEWPPGHRIPFEHELMTQFDCSRMTVNKAISALADAGLVTRRRKAGTFVARPHVQAAVLTIPDIQAEIRARGETYSYRLLLRRRRAARRKDAAECALARDGDLLVLRCLHLAGASPFAVEERLISIAAVPESEHADFVSTPPGTWLLAHVPWTEAEHRIGAAPAGRDEARHLGIDEGAACLVLDRSTWRGREGITRVRQVFPGDAYDLIARFSPRGA